MLNLETLSVALKLSGSSFQAGMKQAESSLNGFRDKLSSVGKSVTAFGQRMTMGVTLPIIGLGVTFTKWASDVEEATSAVTQVYGDGADFIIDKSKGAANAVFISQGEYLDAAATLGVYGEAAGLTGDELAAFGDNNITAAADLASFYNAAGGVPEVLDAIKSGLVGEYEPLRKYGIVLNEASINEYAWANGIAERGEELTEQQKILARQGVILESLGAAEGDAQRTADGLANSTRRLQARFKDIGATIGRILLPVAMKLVNGVGDLFDWVQKLSPEMLKWVVIVAAAAAAIGPLAIIIGTMLPGLGAMLGLLALMISPIGLIVVAAALLAYVFRDELGAAIGWLFDKLHELKVAFDVFSQMTDPVTAILKSLALVFPQVADVIEPLITMVDNLKAAFSAFMDGNFSEGFDKLGDAARNLGTAIKTGLAAIDWSAVLATLASLATALAAWLWAEASAVDWAGVISAAAATAGDITGTIVSRLGNLFTALFLWVWDAASQVAWGDLIAAGAAKSGNVASKIIANIGDLLLELKTWYENAIDGVDWGNLGVTVGEKVGDLAPVLVSKAGEMIQGFLTAASDPGVWLGIATALSALMLAVPLAIGYLGMTLAPKAAEFIAGFITGLDVNWPQVLVWFLLLPAKILLAVGSLALTMIPKGVELITGFLTSLDANWPMIVAWLGLVGIKAFLAVGSLLNSLQPRGKELLTGLYIAVLGYWNGTISPWLSNFGQRAWTAVGSLLLTLSDRGKSLMKGLHSAVVSFWTWTAGPWFSSLDNKILAAVGSLGSLLTQAGRDAIQGLINGVMEKIPFLEDAVDLAIGLFNKIPGLGDSPWPMMIGAGKDSMDGLIIGVGSKMRMLDKQIGGVIDIFGNATPQLDFSSSGFSTDMSGIQARGFGDGFDGYGAQQPIINNYYALTPEEYRKLMENAEAGGTFARSFGPELGMRGGRP